MARAKKATRMRTLLRLAGSGVTLLGLGLAASAQNAPELTNLTNALDTAAAQQKRVFFLCGQQTSPSAQALRGWISDGTIALPAAQFVYCYLDYDDPAATNAFYSRYSVAGLAQPYVVIASSDGLQLLARSGYGTPAQYQALIDRSGTLRAPANDLFANRLPLSGGALIVPDALNSLASKEAGEPDHAGYAGGASVWWQWTAPSNGTFLVTTEGSAFNTLLGVYAGESVAALTLVASNAFGAADGTSRLLLDATATTTYQIAVDGLHGAAGDIVLSIRPPGPPANDDFANRSLIPGWSNTITAWNFEATKQPGEPAHAGNSGGASVWWTWGDLGPGLATVSTAGSSFDTVLAVYEGTNLSTLTVVATNDDYGGELTSRVTFNAEARATYQIAVDGYLGATGVILLSLSAPQPTELGPPLLLSNRVVRLSLSSPPGQTNVIEASADLGAWVPLSTNVQSLPVIQYDDAGATNLEHRFYRVKTWE
jgi:hypothetical protein